MNKSSFLVIVCLILSIDLWGQRDGASPQMIANTDYEEAIETARKKIATLMKERPFPSLSISLGKEGDVIWAEAFGWADKAADKRATIHSQYRIGSVSKSMTALALGKLYEEGKIDLDAPIQKYLPEYPKKEYPITTRQLAGHQAGIRHYRGFEFMSNIAYEDVFEPMKVFQDDTLLFKPGTDYSYSTYGWTIISAIVERASGTPYLTYMREAVIDRLGLVNTLADFEKSPAPQRVEFYMTQRDKFVPAREVDLSNKWAGGGYLSTPSDLVEMGMALLGNDYLKPETIELLMTPQKLADGSESGQNYGLGWRNQPDKLGNTSWSHSGGSVGGRTWLVIWPEQEVVVAVTINTDQGLPKAIVDELAALFFE